MSCPQIFENLAADASQAPSIFGHFLHIQTAVGQTVHNLNHQTQVLTKWQALHHCHTALSIPTKMVLYIFFLNI